MLEIKKITKVYDTGGFKQKALDGVSVNFRESEFAAILGPSGSGKTTFLNIIGGLDHYTSGDLRINEVSTKDYKDRDWDSYRNHRIGFVFQSYNLISHQSILTNVRLALTLSGISKSEGEERARKALIDVGLEDHLHKRPNQLSGGQMQRVAIARALVNDPDILLADEPTGALDSETSVQIMKILKKIAKRKLVIMVTHNPELANEYANRIITLKDGKITSDSNPYDGKVDTKEQYEIEKKKSKKTNMSFLTALALSFNNLMTKKGRTILVAFAGSIGIIGIALIMAVSNGFQNYVDSIQEDALTSYPLMVMEESTDITGILLSMQAARDAEKPEGKVVEQPLVSSMLVNVKANDLKSLKRYLEANYSKVKNDLSTVDYNYNVDPIIYAIDATNTIAKLNPSNLFTSTFGSNSLMSSYSSYTSVYSQMMSNREVIDSQYDVIAGRMPEKYDELIIVLSNPNTIPDLIVYSLGLRDTSELSEMVTKIMSGESANIHHDPLEFTYDDLLNIKLKLVMPTDLYKYNSKYEVYEDMSDDKEYIKDIFNNKAIELKIVGIVTPKEGVTTMSLQRGINYTPELIKYIIDYSSKSELVRKQLDNKDIDVFSNKRFDSDENEFNFEFSDFVSVDKDKLSKAFNVNISEEDIMKEVTASMNDINSSITTDTTDAMKDLNDGFYKLLPDLVDNMGETISEKELDELINKTLSSDKAKEIFANLEKKYILPADTYKLTYQGVFKTMLDTYIKYYNQTDPSLSTEDNMVARVDKDMYKKLVEEVPEIPLTFVFQKTASLMVETVMRRNILTKVSTMTQNLMKSLGSAFNVDPNKITSAFKLNFTEDELARVVTAMMSREKKTLKNNLVKLGYQDLDAPSYISFYFNSFDGKEHFLSFLDSYNKEMEDSGYEEKVIRYSDTTGILMDTVKTIVDAVSYVLIAFVSISLVVSSIMIGIITYISVYERTKEIGILRAIGASKRNIASIFNAETFIVGFLSGLFGIGITYTLIPIINAVLRHYTGAVKISAALPISSAIKLIILSIILTLIGGLIPARAASKKDPVEALRSE
jgi:ABC-type lipoprotein export system ATPase subunit/ABC-type antimicrobial peptide transport system permease subunit